MNDSTFVSTLTNVGFRRLLAYYFLPGIILIAGISVVSVEFRLDDIHNVLPTTTQSIILHGIALLALSMIVGYVLEDLGSSWETHFCHPKAGEEAMAAKTGPVAEIKKALGTGHASECFKFIIHRFMSLSYDESKSLGHRHLRTMVERLKFELNAGIALYLLSLYALSYLFLFIDTTANQRFYYIFIGLTWLLARFLLGTEAAKSSISLNSLRAILVLKYDTKWKSEAEKYQDGFYDNTPNVETNNYTAIRFVWRLLYILVILSLFLITRSTREMNDIFCSMKQNNSND